MLSWRRSANLIPCAGKAAGDEELMMLYIILAATAIVVRYAVPADAKARTGITAN